MNENIDLTKILKDCPKEFELYSSVHGKLFYNGMYISSSASKIYFRHSSSRSIVDGSPILITYLRDGRLYCGEGECTIFPSKDQRDWSKFTATWYKKESNTIEQSQTNERTWLYLVSDVLTWRDGIGQYLDSPRVQEIAKRLCDKYVQKLYNPSILSNSSNTGKDKQRFDPKTFKPFDKVLARMVSSDIWVCDFFSHIHPNEEHCVSVGSWSYNEMIPYNDDTKHLVGTSEKAPEYYRYWEE